ncbi:Ferri-bacillibactin esterase BesA [Methylobacterium crusticola]|uniref:Ferri-bacillibactin esterase BesA n=1 Tax=Methylobacterium crusticola TaxID=1697972 RepID=A0ABQ4QTP7_9HYPH|nr:alpha/beta hydrolase-fold protein [Methylobacterium crusticola]GJD48431.1 Ferri-bacillibactin esterase BesA [Methylobacterium crusticola]
MTLPGAVRFDLAPAAGGAPYRIFLRRPAGAAPEAGWPVLYLLDGNAVFATAVDALRVQEAYPGGTGTARAVLVAVGYPTEAPYDALRRGFDLSPPPGRTYPPFAPGGPEVRTGGAARFLSFLESDLRPAVARRLPVDAGRQGIYGHSFGGLFVLYALFNRPEAFTHWVAASPSVGWEDGILLRSAERFAASGGGPAGRRVLVTVGGCEQEGLVADARRMVERLRGLAGIEAAFAEVRGETHMSVLPATVSQAVRFCLGTWPGPGP